MDIQKVLLVDDEADIRTIGEISLASVGGWNVVLASSGLEALEMAKRHLPDVILLDVMMPDVDGPMTFARLREEPSTQNIPVIFVTAKVQRQEVNRYLELGALGVIAKPFDPMTLPTMVRDIVSKPR